MKTKRRRSRRSSKRLGQRESHSLLGEVTRLPRGVVLYSGCTHPDLDSPMFLTPHKSLAGMYAAIVGGSVFRFKTIAPLTLVTKRDVVWALKGGHVTHREWEGFGTDGGDLPVARALCRRRASDTSWLRGVDGWIHQLASPTLGEVLLCTPRTVLKHVSIDRPRKSGQCLHSNT